MNRRELDVRRTSNAVDTDNIDILAVNRRAWDRQVAQGNQWTVPVSSEEIEAARNGSWSVLLTPTKPAPHAWFPKLQGADVLCLACGGGHDPVDVYFQAYLATRAISQPSK